MVRDQTLETFLEALSSASPTPGGGAVSALVGAIASSLNAMVANLTIGKKKYIKVAHEMSLVLNESLKLRETLIELMDKDIIAFNSIMRAYKLPKTSESERLIRAEKIEEASIEASEVPLTTAKICLRVMEFALEVAKQGNINAVSDALCAAYFANAAIKGAILNIKINLKNIHHTDVLQKFSNAMSVLEVDAEKLYKETEQIAQEIMK